MSGRGAALDRRAVRQDYPSAVRSRGPSPMDASTVLATSLMALGYLLVLRLCDANEREPLWAIALTFGLGAMAAVGLRWVVPATVLELHPVPSAIAHELARFVAVGGAVFVLVLVARRRGFSEINGLMDGVVYGGAAGLGGATGAAIVAATVRTRVELLPDFAASAFASFGKVALTGLADGVFGALMGVGFAGGLHACRPVARASWVLAGFACAVLAHLGHAELGWGASLAGAAARARAWVALGLPLCLVVGVAVVALVGERRAIGRELASELDAGLVRPMDLALLGGFVRREVYYVRTLLRGGVRAARLARTLHNRQVQLAMAKQRAARDAGGAAAAAEAAALRAAIVALLRRIEAGAPTAGEPASDPGASS